MKLGGIYCIENIETGKKYIGQSVNIEKRRQRHFLQLKNKTHDNSHLQNAWNKYGETAFKFKVLIYCEPFELTKYEQFFVDLYAPEELYNICVRCVNSSLGTIHSEESRQKISINHADVSGRNNPNYGKYGEQNPIYGIKRSFETKKKMSNSMKGVVFSEEHNRNISKSHKGVALSETHRLHISNANKGGKNGRAKLKESDILDILNLYYIENQTKTNIANKYSLCRSSVANIINGKAWKDIYRNFNKQ